MKNICAAFVKAQRDFAPALKTNTNPHFRSKYVGLDGCIEAVLDSLNGNGIALLQPTHECADGVTVETLFIHESGETMSGGKFHVPASKQDAQGYGSALTYARRYSLMAACGIAPEDDDGNAASKPPQRPVKAVQKPTVNDAEGPVGHNPVNETEPAPEPVVTKPAAGAVKKDRSLVHKPTDGAADGFTEEQLQNLQEIAMYLIDCHKSGKDLEAIRFCNEPSNFAHSDEKVYVWSQLAAYPTLRSAINANKTKAVAA